MNWIDSIQIDVQKVGKTKEPVDWSVPIYVMVFLLFVGIVCGVAMLSPKKKAVNTARPTKHTESYHSYSLPKVTIDEDRIITNGKQYLLRALKCPTTAQITVLKTQKTSEGYLVGGKVTATNSFNASLTQTWIVMLDVYYTPMMLMIDDEIYVEK